MYRQDIALFISLFWIPDWNPIVTQPNRLRQFKTSSDILGNTTGIALHKTYEGKSKLLCSIRVPII